MLKGSVGLAAAIKSTTQAVIERCSRGSVGLAAAISSEYVSHPSNALVESRDGDCLKLWGCRGRTCCGQHSSFK
ncbi:hypothetical protein AAMO2058_000876300 [Amorphochlora amoebiformis]